MDTTELHNGHNRPITHEEAQRALYLDFEGRGPASGGPDPLPLIAGIACEGEYTATALDLSIEMIAERPDVDFMPLDHFLGELLDQAMFEERRIVFWTSHEKMLFTVRGYPPGHIGFDVRVPAKAHPKLKHYFREFRTANKKIRNAGVAKTTKSVLRTKAFGLLAIIADDLGLKRPANYGPGFVGKWLRTMQEQSRLKSGLGYDRWSPSGKRNTTKLLKHNEHDCRATEFLLKWLLEHEPEIYL